MDTNINLKSGQKALSTQILTLAIFIILIALIGLVLQKFSTTSSGFKDYQQSTQLLKDVYSAHTNLHKIKSMVAVGQDKQEIDKVSNQTAAVISEDINLVKKALESNISAEQKKYYQGIMNNLVEYQKSSGQAIKLAPMNSGGAYVIASNEKMDAITGLLSQLQDFEGQASGGSSSSLTFYLVIVVLLVLLALCFVLIPSFINKMITGTVIAPIQETSGILREFANGKYNKSLAWDGDDAIGELVQSVNALRSKMSIPTLTASPVQKTPTPEVAPAQKAPALEVAPAKKPPAPEVVPVQKSPTPEAVAASKEAKTKSLSDMIKKAPEQVKETDKLVTSSRKAIDKLQDI